MALGKLPIAANGLTVVPIGNDIWACVNGGGGGEDCLADKIR